MTAKEAHRFATRLWGSTAVIAEESIVGLDEDGATVIVRTVGHVSHDRYSWTVRGRGATWADAFESAGVRRRGLVP